MTHPLQTKDDQWRQRDHNAAVPVLDPGAAPASADAEAGGAHAPPPNPQHPVRDDLPTRPDPGAPGVRLPPNLWVIAAGALVVTLVVAALFSL
ncbi:MAG: hypothetical protein Q7V15_13545 [Phenylobacterium sp.]|uniref:hypothetical protein n=1 Tax=Phenylobacterium sp. TaxID=1871053 RepID=UPI0027260117|nr:hypothetical protein [Phenylobacterium sp.]MDO8902366.1 hypothetical protein [Phenylobacterium sp.]MDP2215535.1 hypothetical protein [Phenylobacterium sp.]